MIIYADYVSIYNCEDVLTQLLTFCYIFVCYSHLRQCYCYIRLFFKLFLFKRLLNTNWCFLGGGKHNHA